MPAPCFQEWVLPSGERWAQFFRAGSDYIVRFPKLADFKVSSDGRLVRCSPSASIPAEIITHLYLNQVLPLALSRQGALVFHASAVDIQGKGIAFVGNSGKGKSTLAASFATNGFHFLTDDGLIVDLLDGQHRIIPSHPSIRLWKDSEEFLVTKPATIGPRIHFNSKTRLLANENVLFQDQPRSLDGVYFLGANVPAETVFERVRPAVALIELVRNSFLLDLDEKESLAGHFEELSLLVSRPIFYRINHPRRYESLANVRRAIVEHATSASRIA